MNTHLSRAGLLVLLAALAPLTSCGSNRAAHTPPRSAITTEGALPGTATNIMLDGDISDWPGDAVIAANDHYVFIRFTVEDQQYTLQSSPTTTAIMLDVDGDPGTGRTS